MFQPINHFVTRLPSWKTRRNRLTAERGSIALISTARDRLTSARIMMIMGVLDPTNMESTTTTTTTAVIMTTSTIAVMIMTSIRTTRVDIRATTVEVEVKW